MESSSSLVRTLAICSVASIATTESFPTSTAACTLLAETRQQPSSSSCSRTWNRFPRGPCLCVLVQRHARVHGRPQCWGWGEWLDAHAGDGVNGWMREHDARRCVGPPRLTTDQDLSASRAARRTTAPTGAGFAVDRTSRHPSRPWKKWGKKTRCVGTVPFELVMIRWSTRVPAGGQAGLDAWTMSIRPRLGQCGRAGDRPIGR